MKDNEDIISLDQFRNRKQEEKKRKTERIFFDHLVGVYAMVSPAKMVQVNLTDVSEEGLGIQVPYQSEKIWPTQMNDISIRLYFSAENFMELVMDIRNTRPVIEGGSRYLRYGCAVRMDQRSFAAWSKFVSFLRAFSEISERDSGNVGVGSI
jgi:hypothetical protein